MKVERERQEALSFPVPAEAVAEVTDDPRFTGGVLATAHRDELGSWLAGYTLKLESQ